MSIKSTIKSLFKLTDHKLISEYIRGLAWSPNGNYLAIVSAAGELALWQEGKINLLNPKSNYSLDCLGFSPDGQWLATGGQTGEVQIWRSEAMPEGLSQDDTFGLVTTLNYDRAWIDSLVWHPQENLLAFAVNRKIKIWDADIQKIITPLDFKDSSVFSLAWHPQGNLLAASGHGGVKVWQSDNWMQQPNVLKVPGASLDCAWSSDGKYLASGNLDRTISLLHWDNPLPWLMQGFPGKVSQVVWSPNNKAMVAASCQEGIIVWQFKDRQWHSQILKHQKTVRAIAFAPNSSLLASAGDDGYLKLWQEKKLIQTLQGVTNGFSCLAWHPTRKYVAAGGQDGELIIWQQTFSGKGFKN